MMIFLIVFDVSLAVVNLYFGITYDAWFNIFISGGLVVSATFFSIRALADYVEGKRQ